MLDRTMTSRATGRLRRLITLGAVALLPAMTAGVTTPPAADAQTAPGDDIESFAPTDWTQTQAPQEQFARLSTGAGRVRAIVGVQVRFVPEGVLAPADVDRQRASIASAGDRVIAALAGTSYVVARRYTSVPYLALDMAPDAVAALQRSGRAANVTTEPVLTPSLDATTPVIEATETRALGRRGAGKAVVVLDTGVDKNHPFLRNLSTTSGASVPKVIAEACFSTPTSANTPNFSSLCPGGAAFSSAAGSGMPCTGYASCDHGTHVAGIAAGEDQAPMPLAGPPPGPRAGVAPGADLIAIQVFSVITPPSSPSFLGGNGFDILAALDYVNVTLAPSFSIAAVNMSLGALSPSMCDTAFAKPAVDNLMSKKIATVASSGNNAVKDATINLGHIAWPACLSPVVAVGRTDNTDVVGASSNSSGELDLLAPGTGVTSSVPGGGFAVKSGTSMSAPHVAGSWAVMRSVNPAASVTTVLSYLQSSGKPVNDSANGIVTPRIRLLAASVRLEDTGFKGGGAYSYPGGGLASAGVGLRPGATRPIVLAGVPANATVKQAFLYWVTIGGADGTATFAGQPVTGALVGASRNTCDNVNQLGPNRTYRASVPLSALTANGNGQYLVGGIGGGPDGVEAQGASLLVLYSDPTSTVLRRVFIKHGAKSVRPIWWPTMSDSFAPPGQTPQGTADLHVGMAGGDSSSEDPLLFDGWSATTPNAFSGPFQKWDNIARSVPLGAGGSHVVSITTTGNCLAWAYTALAY